jgi:catechol 2,3-dioxygenase-like lactoylglutathione lyase family enzyme
VEDLVEALCEKFNHVVEYRSRHAIVNRKVEYLPRTSKPAGSRRDRRGLALIRNVRLDCAKRRGCRQAAGEGKVRKLQAQGVHHITLVGADRQTSIDFWEGVLGMPFVFEQPNLDLATESHLYFDPGDGRLITVFTDETRKADPAPTARDQGAVHHIAFSVSRVTFLQAVERLDERGIAHSGVKDRGFMDSVYFRDPLGLLIELSSYRFEPPAGISHVDVLTEAHEIRVARGDPNIAEIHLADAIESLIQRRNKSLSNDRSPKNPYGGAEAPKRKRVQLRETVES